MKKSFLLVLSLLCCIVSIAQTIVEEREVSQEARGRIGASVDFKAAKWCTISLVEEIRLNHNFTSFDRFDTEINLSFKPIKHLKLGVDYIFLSLYKPNKETWDLRHRINADVTGSFDIDRWEFSLRERFQTTFRQNPESYNPEEKVNPAFVLRTKLKVEYKVFSKPLKPYLAIEMMNPLNQTKYTHIWIDEMTYRLGIEWRLSKSSSLDFYYMFDHFFGKDVDVKPKKNKVVITDKIEYNHVIGVFYNYRF